MSGNGGYGNQYSGQYGNTQQNRRIDALDVLEGVLKDGFSLSNFTRIARASGSKFWLGAAIGAGLVVVATRPDVRAAVSGVLHAGTAAASGKSTKQDI